MRSRRGREESADEAIHRDFRESPTRKVSVAIALLLSGWFSG
jgi:hypothetical protein